MSVEVAAPGKWGSLAVPPNSMLVISVQCVLSYKIDRTSVEFFFFKSVKSGKRNWSLGCIFVCLSRKSSRLQREEKASNGKQQAGKHQQMTWHTCNKCLPHNPWQYIFYWCHRCSRRSRGLVHSQEKPFWFAEKRSRGGRSFCTTKFQDHEIQTRRP